MSYVTIIIGDKSTYQVLDQDSGAGEANPDRIYVPLTGAFAPGDEVWVSDDNSTGELGTIQAIVVNDYLDMVDNLTGLYTVAQNAKVCLVNVISNDTIDADTWRNRLTAVGTCKLRLSNVANKYEGFFAPDDPIVISIVGTIVWMGFVDDVRPYLPEKGVHINELIVTGRDHGRFLTDLSFTKSYKKQQADAIITDILSDLGDPLLFTDPGVTPEVKYEGVRAKLGDALREICERCSPGYDFYIDNNGRLQFIQAGSVDSTVDLVMSTPGVVTDNLLTFQEYEQVGTSIKNSIEIHAGSVKDHYTDGNSDDFSVGGGGAVADSDTHIYGIQSIELTCTGAPSQVFLEFDANPVLADYGYSGSVDLSKLSEAKVMIRGERTGENYFSLRPFLVDGGGNKIVFVRTGPDATIGGKGGSKGWTENIVCWSHRAYWTQLSYPLGAHDSNPIKVGPSLVSGFWTFTVGAAPFDWTDVRDVGFEYPFTENAVILIDGWSIPSLEAKSIQTDAGSITSYGLRMYTEFRREMRSQKQLIIYAKRLLALRKDPLQKFKGVAKGQVGTKYAAQTVDVDVPAYGINDDPYTITVVHHKLHNNRNVRGWDFLTEYELAAQDAPAYMIILDDNPLETGMDRLARDNRGFKGGMEAEDSLLGDIQSGRIIQETRGTYFPSYPADGDLHWLTADYNDAGTGFMYYGIASGLLYTYDEVAAKWIRGPANLGHRAANPAAGLGGGEYTGDTYYNTTDDQTYQWDGAAWVPTSSMDLGDLGGEVAAGQLAIEQRDWHSNLNFIWDVANKDWDEIWWGLRGNEVGADAVIEFSDGTTTTIDRNTEAALADGYYIYYWDENFKAGGTYQLQRDTFANWDSGVGAGKGIVAVVVINEAAADPPSFYLFNSYAATIGAGLLSAWTVKTNHLTAESIYGKDIATQASVGEVAGNAGIRIIGDAADIVGTAIGDAIGGNFAAGIYGFAAGPVRTYWLDPATGIIWLYGSGKFGIRTYPGDALVGYLGSATVNLGLGTGNQTSLRLNDPVVGQVLTLDAAGRSVWLDQVTNQIVIDDDWNRMVPAVDGGVDSGSTTLRWGKLWTEDGDFELQLTIPRYNGADPGAPVAGDIWLRTDL